ncbi:hypothetical protein O181_005929 [Austropuccinia psidii MF-1]|uniref:Uncharacterized protein n=1 Tax=Austropuccinia psidii MF-1 TaxID=1389203 RepID=A0A9Q3BIE9_9BASI|nr:hypothetical protein [Austropuccinia psidii MF-1]
MNASTNLPSTETSHNTGSHLPIDPVFISQLQQNLSQKDETIFNLLQRVQGMEIKMKEDHILKINEKNNASSSGSMSDTKKTKKSQKKTLIKKKVFAKKINKCKERCTSNGKG